MQRPHFIADDGAFQVSLEAVVGLAGVKVPKNLVKKPIDVVLVDEHPVVLAGIESYLRASRSARIVAQGSRFEEAVDASSRSGALVVLDLAPIPEVIRQFRAALPDAKLLVFTAIDDEESILRAIEAGAQGFVSKTAGADELLRAIERVHAGATYFSARASEILAREAARERARRDVRLTQKELDVLTEVAKGRTTKEIADRLGLKISAVETHRQRVMQKLDIHTTARLTRYAVASGIVEL